MASEKHFRGLALRRDSRLDHQRRLRGAAPAIAERERSEIPSAFSIYQWLAGRKISASFRRDEFAELGLA
jgi:hypothetical protein